VVAQSSDWLSVSRKTESAGASHYARLHGVSPKVKAMSGCRPAGSQPKGRCCRAPHADCHLVARKATFRFFRSTQAEFKSAGDAQARCDGWLLVYGDFRRSSIPTCRFYVLWLLPRFVSRVKPKHKSRVETARP
jgi:hypothetical protein